MQLLHLAERDDAYDGKRRQRQQRTDDRVFPTEAPKYNSKHCCQRNGKGTKAAKRKLCNGYDGPQNDDVPAVVES